MSGIRLFPFGAPAYFQFRTVKLQEGKIPFQKKKHKSPPPNVNLSFSNYRSCKLVFQGCIHLQLEVKSTPES